MFVEEHNVNFQSENNSVKFRRDTFDIMFFYTNLTMFNLTLVVLYLLPLSWSFQDGPMDICKMTKQ